VLLARGEYIKKLEEECKPVGIYRNTRPLITEVPLETGLTVVVYTDGIVHAGSRDGQPMEVDTILQSVLDEGDPTAQEITDALLEYALKLDQGRPVDDISIIALRVTPETSENKVRRMVVRLPIGL
jgi:serine phosphatase RsbU (regulator of sigma subunit)